MQREKEREIGDVAEDVKRMRVKGGENREQLAKLQTDMQELDSQQGQLLNQLKRIDQDVARGWEWLKDHQDSFDQEVFGPPMLTCSVKDKRYTDLVQSMLQANDFLCFTAQTREDHKKLSDQFYNKMGLSVTIRSCFTPYHSFQPPLPRGELSNLGFDGFVNDYLDGPEPVLAMLCAEKRLHSSALSLNDISEDQFERIQKAESLTQFAGGRQLYRITRRREYGAGAVSTRVTQFGQGRFWADQPVDAAEKTELLQKIEELKAEQAALKAEFNAGEARKAVLDNERNEIATKIVRPPFADICYYPVFADTGAVGTPDIEKRAPARVHKMAVVARQNRYDRPLNVGELFILGLTPA